VRVPAGAVACANPAGLAPGFELPLGAATIYVMPGVPRELEAIWAGSIAPRVAARVAGGEAVARAVLRVFGMGESHIDHRLEGIATGVPGATVHYQVVFPETLVKLVVKDADPARAQAVLDRLAAEARARLGDAVYGEGKDSLAAALGRALGAAKATLATAESCTGGLLGALVTDVAGASEYYLGGWVTYADAAKVRDLGVHPETLAAHGAVSRECAEAMARGARTRAGATLAVAITGIAGPGGGTPDKPVGTVHMAVARPDGEVVHKHYTFPGARDQVRRLAAYWAMAMVMKEVRA
jgi:nicotinamide-nucleotide amidase